MNYSKKKAAQKQRKITSKSTMQGKRVGIRLLKAFFLCILVVGVAGLVGGGLFVKKIVDDAPKVSPSDVKPQGYTTFVYADDEKTEIERFVASGSNRIYKSIDEIPVDLQHAFVAIEDERFYEHNGIDIRGIARSAVSLLQGHMQGASTLTQQLIKNNVFPNFVNEQTFYDKLQRKFQEQFLALQIEKQMSKDEIIEAYMNTINLGQNSLGVQSAAKRYFNKNVEELSLSESAVIAGITQNPSRLNPVTNPEKNAERRKKVLKDMLEQGYITEDAYAEALADDVYARIQKASKKTDDKNPYTYFVDALSDQVLRDLKDKLGYTETQAYNALYSGGLSIYSTQDLDLQKICDEEMNNDENYPYLKEYGLDYALTVTRADGSIENYSSGHIKKYAKEKHNKTQGLLYSSSKEAKKMVKEWKKTIKKEGDTYDEVINITPQPQASVTLMDQKTGQIKAMVGGRGKKKSSLGLNRAYKGSKRQPGSTFKVLAAYAPAMDACDKTLATVVRDEPTKYKNGKQIKNASRGYKGDVSYRKAIANSINVCAVKVSNEITQQLGFDYCEKFGITTLVKSKNINGKIYSDINETLALGGLTDGVYNYQLCGAYAAIANGGEYNRPIMYSKVLDHDGNVLLEGKAESHRVLKESTAALVTSALESVVKEGTGTACRLSNMPVAGKTGTTTSNKDLWFCGFTPYYTCAVWGGYDDNKECNNDTRFRFRIWKGIMERVHDDLEYQEFDMPDSVEKKSVCKLTGMLSRAGRCPSVTEYFDTDVLPDEVCSGHGDVDDGDEDDEDEEEEEEEGETPPEDGDGNQPTTPTTPTTPTPPSTPSPTPPSGNGNGGGTTPGGDGNGGGTTNPGGDGNGGGTTNPGGDGNGGNSGGDGNGGGTTPPTGGDGTTTTP